MALRRRVINCELSRSRARRDAPLSTGTRWITLADTDSDLTVPGYSRLIDSPDVANAVGMVADIISDATIWLMENTDEGDQAAQKRAVAHDRYHPVQSGDTPDPGLAGL